MARRRSRKSLGALGEPITGSLLLWGGAALVALLALGKKPEKKGDAGTSSASAGGKTDSSSSGASAPGAAAESKPDLDQARTQATMLFFAGLDADALQRYDSAACKKDSAFKTQCEASKWFAEYAAHEERAS